jgi:prepilin-type N-terminal cleavage/methylation domain-containing protein
VNLHRESHEQGFSLTELMVVLALLGFVLTAAYAALQLTLTSSAIQRREAFVATSIVEPLQMMDVTLSQNITIDAAGTGDYTLSCLTDANADNQLERHVYKADSTGQLVEEVYRVDSLMVNTSLARRTVWQRIGRDPASRNVNMLLGQPVFSYRSMNASGVVVPATPAQANMVDVRLFVRYDGVAYSDSRRIMFRNR